MEIGRVDPGRLVFVDEMGAHTSLAPLRGYAPVGRRAFFEIPRNRGKRHDAAYESPSRRDGAIDGRGRGNHLSSVRDLRGALARSEPA